MDTTLPNRPPTRADKFICAHDIPLTEGCHACGRLNADGSKPPAPPSVTSPAKTAIKEAVITAFVEYPVRIRWITSAGEVVDEQVVEYDSMRP
jgi:hypothetical protein